MLISAKERSILPLLAASGRLSFWLGSSPVSGVLEVSFAGVDAS
jgi:hypothetical protein